MCRGLSVELKGSDAQKLSVPMVALYDSNSHILPSNAKEMLRAFNLKS